MKEAIPGASIEVTRHLSASAAKQLSLNLRLAIEDNNLEPSAENAARVLDELGPYYHGKPSPRTVTNPFTGAPLRMEKSPGNIWVQPSTHGLDMIWYDFDGAPGFTNEVF